MRAETRLVGSPSINMANVSSASFEARTLRSTVSNSSAFSESRSDAVTFIVKTNASYMTQMESLMACSLPEVKSNEVLK